MNDEILDALKDAGWALYKAALYASTDDSQADAFEAAEKAAEALQNAGRWADGYDIKKAVEDF